jgi:hypothetical protein
MKKWITLLVFAFVAMVTSAQQGKVYTLTNDTITNTGTVYSDVVTSTGAANSIVFQVVTTQLSGTSAGTAILQGSVDGTSYVTLSEKNGLIAGLPNDTLTISNGAIWNITVLNSPWKYYKIKAVGSGTSSTKVVYKYIYK